MAYISCPGCKYLRFTIREEDRGAPRREIACANCGAVLMRLEPDPARQPGNRVPI